jgi:hypothetical protein
MGPGLALFGKVQQASAGVPGIGLQMECAAEPGARPAPHLIASKRTSHPKSKLEVQSSQSPARLSRSVNVSISCGSALNRSASAANSEKLRKNRH